MHVCQLAYVAMQFGIECLVCMIGIKDIPSFAIVGMPPTCTDNRSVVCMCVFVVTCLTFCTLLWRHGLFWSRCLHNAMQPHELCVLVCIVCVCCDFV